MRKRDKLPFALADSLHNGTMNTPSFAETIHAMLYRMAEYASYNLMEDAAMLAFIFS